ncbi:MAG: phage baseplate assembly protein V [bacterium]
MGLFVRDQDERKRFLGMYRAEIVEIDEGIKIGRARLRIPEVLGEVTSSWAYMASPILGGTFSPDIRLGMRVFVFFIGGDPDRPVWTHQWFAAPDAEEETPAAARGIAHDATKFPRGYQKFEFVDLDGETITILEPTPAFQTTYPHSTVLRTPTGMQVEMDSSSPTRSRFQVWHPSGSYYEIRPDGSMTSVNQGSSFRSVKGGETESVGNHWLKSVEGVGAIRAKQGLDVQVVHGAMRFVSENGDMIIGAKDRRTATVGGVDTTTCGAYVMNSLGRVEMLAADSIVIGGKTVESIAVGQSLETVSNAFGATEAHRRVVILGNDVLQFAGVGSRLVNLTEGTYQIAVASGAYNVTVASGSGAISIPAGPFSITALSVDIRSTTTLRMAATTSAELEAPRFDIRGTAVATLTGGSAVKIESAGVITLAAPAIALSGVVAVAGATTTAGVITTFATVGSGSEQAIKGNSLLAYLRAQTAIFNAHLHGTPSGPSTSPTSVMTAPDNSMLSNFLRLD